MKMIAEGVIILENITKRYQTGAETFYALRDISLSIEENEYVAIVGPSGSGKSSLMNILGCLDVPTAGEYVLSGQRIASLDEVSLAQIRNRSVGFIFQSFNLLPKASALGNVMQPLVYRKIPLSMRKEMAINSLTRVGLEDKLQHFPNQLSGGQRQRVAIARALVTKPAIILGDELTGNLDSKTTNNIMRLLNELHGEGHTIILVTHEQDIAAHCRRVIRLVDGRIAFDSRNVDLR